MPSSKRRSSSGGSSTPTPSKPPLHSWATPHDVCSTTIPSPSPSPSGARAAAAAAMFSSPQSPEIRVLRNRTSGFTATVVAIDHKDVKGRAFLWMSEAAMLTASCATGSLVSVSILGPSGDVEVLKDGTLDPLCEHSIVECGDGKKVARNEALGAVMAIAVAWPWKKLVRNEVRLSRVLAYSLGSPALGSSVSLKPLEFQSLTAADPNRLESKGAIPAIKHESTLVSIRWCPTAVQSLDAMDATPELQSLPGFSKDELTSSSPSMRTPRRQDIESGQSKGRSFSLSPGSKFPSSEGRGGTKSPMHEDLREKLHVNELKTETQGLQNWASVRASFEKGREKVKALLEVFAARWLVGRYLLPGNLIHIPLCGCDCMLIVTNIKGAIENNSSGKVVACSPVRPELEDTAKMDLPLTHSLQPLAVYLMDQKTKVTLLPPQREEEELETVSLQVQQKSEATTKGLQGATVAGVDADVDGIKYSALGGLSAQIEKLKQHVELSLLCPQHLTRYGLQPVRGVLLHGPPGTGKSSLARAAACEAGVKMFTVNGPEIVSEFYGESEAALRAIFSSAAEQGPSVVFIDELDALVPERKDGSEELGQRLVAALLTLMDGGGQSLDGVLVIAATNRIDAIDPALRRPGRFDLEIEIGVPSPPDRLGILEVLLRGIQHTLTHSDMADLAATTYGFVGADLAALCNEAAMSALRTSVHLHQADAQVAGSGKGLSDFTIWESNSIPRQPAEGQDSSLKVTLQDFQVAKTKVRPSAMREVALEVPKVRWSDIGGHNDVKQKLKEIVEWPQKQSEAIARMGVDPPHGVLLHGPPGCSKTLMARAVASETGLNFIGVKGPELFSKWVGESEKAVQTLFARARAAAPSVVFFDEIDGLAVKRESHGDGVSVGDRVMSQLLTEMDGLVPMKGISVIAATNRLDIIDSALLRPGRFDRILFVGPPDEGARQQIFDIHLRQTPCSPDVSYSQLAGKTEFYTGADIQSVCREAAMAALEENVDANQVTMNHFSIAMMRVKPSGNGIR